MHRTTALTLGFLLVAATASAASVDPPPVVLNLGPLKPTPAPTPKRADKKRLITTVTVKNSPDGDTIVSFEATDFSDEGENKFKMLASKNYAIAEAEEKVGLRPNADRILRMVRDLEREMLTFVETSGPPIERPPITGQ